MIKVYNVIKGLFIDDPLLAVFIVLTVGFGFLLHDLHIPYLGFFLVIGLLLSLHFSLFIRS